MPKRKLKIAVRELVEYVLRSGDLNLEFMSFGRPLDAIRAHQKLQQSRPDNYNAEVAVSHQIETERYILTIGGRIDGVFSATDPIIIEEIKTTTRELEDFEQHENPIHWGQVKVYAYIFAIENNLESICTQLTYYHLDTGETREFKRESSVAELDRFFRNLIDRYLEWAATITDWQHLRDASIHELKFPFAEYRPGQRAMAVEIYRAIQTDSQLLIQAATGIGKTMAAMFPAIKAVAEGLTVKIFYLTARTTGRMAAEKALDELCKKGLRLKSITLTAKDKICFDNDNACSPDECEFARGHYDRIDGALKDIFRTDVFSRTAIEDAAREHQVCPFEFSLDLALWADCIICDYNYAFDPRVYLRRFFDENGDDYVFLIDEAHNLVDRSRDMFSAELYKQPVLDLRRALKDHLSLIYKRLGKINSWMVKARKKCEQSGLTRAENSAPDDLYPHLRTFLKSTERWLAKNLKVPYRDQLLEMYFAVTGFIRVAENYDENYATCYEKLDKDLRLKLYCIDPSRQMQAALQRCRVAIFFSATMTPMDYFKQILGCSENAHTLVLPSPFPAVNFKILAGDRVSTLYRDRNRTKPEVASAIRTLVSQKKGNYLLFFPSYAYMQLVSESFVPDVPDTEVILQTPGMSEPEREAFIGRFETDNPQTLIGFAVMGGIFGEGIDLVGTRLSAAVIVGVGLPGISLERDLIRDHFAAGLNQGFEYAYMYPGLNRVLQAAGRVIRTETDRGVVLLIDQRYATYRYKSLLPHTWKPVRIKDQEHLAQELQHFWKTDI